MSSSKEPRALAAAALQVDTNGPPLGKTPLKRAHLQWWKEWEFLKERVFRRVFNSNKQPPTSDKGPFYDPGREKKLGELWNSSPPTQQLGVTAEMTAVAPGEPVSCLTTRERKQYLLLKDTMLLQGENVQNFVARVCCVRHSKCFVPISSFCLILTKAQRI